MSTPPNNLLSCLQASVSESGSRVLDPSSTPADYDTATLPYNTRFASSVDPLAVVLVHSAAEIGKVVQCSVQYNVPAVPRSGGHSYGAYSLGGAIGGTDSANTPRPGEASVIIDLRGLRSINYNSGSQTVDVGPGAMIGELVNALNDQGRMLPAGSCPTVGIGGHAISGGFGLASRKYGFLADQIVSLEIVAADGTLQHVSATQNKDLFFALRGGGSSFGIVYSFNFKTYPTPPSVWYYEWTLLPRALPAGNSTAMRAANYFQAFQDFAKDQTTPSDMAVLWHATPEKSGSTWGTKVEVIGQFMGSEADYRNAKANFFAKAASYGENNIQVQEIPYNFIDSQHHVGGDWSKLNDRTDLNLNDHRSFYVKSYIHRQDITYNTMYNNMRDLLSLSPTENPDTGVDWFSLGPYLGGNSAVSANSGGAFAYRDLKMFLEYYARQLSSGYDTISLVGRLAAAMGAPQAIYPAYVDTQVPAGAFPKLYYGDLYSQLQTVKATWDPLNIFRQVQSVKAGPYQESTYSRKRGNVRPFLPQPQKSNFQLEEDLLLEDLGEIVWPKSKPSSIEPASKIPNSHFTGYLAFTVLLCVVLYHLRYRRRG